MYLVVLSIVSKILPRKEKFFLVYGQILESKFTICHYGDLFVMEEYKS